MITDKRIAKLKSDFERSFVELTNRNEKINVDLDKVYKELSEEIEKLSVRMSDPEPTFTREEIRTVYIRSIPKTLNESMTKKECADVFLSELDKVKEGK